MIALVAFCLVCASAQRWSHPPPAFPKVMDFEDWKTFFQPEGYRSLLEHEDRRRAYEDNVAYIMSKNLENNGLTLGVNQFSAMTHDEFRNTVLMQPLDHENHVRENVVDTSIDSPKASIDWRTSGAVTPVKNQGQCGSCWAFSTTGAIEGCVQIATGKLISVSEQELVSCSKTSHGCHGGWPTRAMEWVKSNGGIDTERDYPYTHQDDYCNRQKQGNKVVVTNDHINVRGNSDSAFVGALNKGPVAVLIDAEDRNFQSYRGGIMTQSCGNNLDHAVLAVGYDSQSYTIKNSWGNWWGEKGYIRFARRVGDNGYGKCGVLMQPSQPVACKLVGPAPPTPTTPTPTTPTTGPTPTTPKPTTPEPHPTPTPGTESYANPANGCKDGEIELAMTGVGVTGTFCAPSCSTKSCPRPPSHIRGISSCGYRDEAAKTNYCAVYCNPSEKNECDSSQGMTCKPYGFFNPQTQTGVCTYGGDKPKDTMTVLSSVPLLQHGSYFERE